MKHKISKRSLNRPPNLLFRKYSYCNEVIPFNHSSLVKNPMLSASNFHAKTNIIICKEEKIKDREKSEMIMATLLMENTLKQTFPVVHYKTLQLLIVNYPAAEKCRY